MTIKCPLCDQEFENSDDGAHTHVWIFHRPPRSTDFFDVWKERSTHLLRVARGEEPLAKRYEKLLGPGRYTKEAAEVAKNRGKIVLTTPISSTKSPSSNITYGTPRKRRK